MKANYPDNVKHSQIINKLKNIDWGCFEDKLLVDGFATTPSLLSTTECKAIRELYENDGIFRSRIVMERYAFGRGEYKYFSYPLPDVVNFLRMNFYKKLSPIANRWHKLMRIKEQFPAELKDFTKICNDAGQIRPTPLMLKYNADDYCCLHQDIYGENTFPFQMIFLLSAPAHDFTGGELLLAESNSKFGNQVNVISLEQGQAIVFAVNSKPAKNKQGYYRVNLRHGVSKIIKGNRETLGIIFHDAK